MTYSEFYRKTLESLCSGGISEAESDTRLLFEQLIHKDRNYILVHGDQEISAKEAEVIEDALAKRLKHIPLQHITGVQDFMGLTFKVNENVLIPRFDTECLVEEVMTDCCDGAKVLDMCTGSGCIILSLMHYKNDIEAYAVDISEKALEVAKENAECLEKQVSFIQSDLFEQVSEKGFDYILSNPPYIRHAEIENLMEEVKDHDPMMALDGGDDGLIFYRRLAKDSREYLKNGGKIYFEIGYDQGQAVKDILEESGYKNTRVIKDYSGNDRVVCAMK